MLSAILSTLQMIGLLGIVLFLLVTVNTVTNTISNVWSGYEEFSIKKLFKGIGKALVFYICAALLSIAFTMLPFINEMIAINFGEILISQDALSLLSTVGVFGTVTSAIVVQGKKAIEGIGNIINTSTPAETITWEVEEENEDE